MLLQQISEVLDKLALHQLVSQVSQCLARVLHLIGKRTEGKAPRCAVLSAEPPRA